MAVHLRNRKGLFFVLAGLMVASLSSVAQKGNQPFRADQLSELTRIGIMIGKGIPLSEVQNSWKKLVGNDKNLNIEIAIKKVIAASKQESQRNIAVLKEKVQFHSMLRKNISTEMSKVRSLLREINQTKDRYINLQRKMYILTPDTRGQVMVIQTGTITTKKEMTQYIDELESQWRLVGTDTQLANIELQNAMQQQQQMLSILPNVTKQLNDSAMSVIRKIGG